MKVCSTTCFYSTCFYYLPGVLTHECLAVGQVLSHVWGSIKWIYSSKTPGEISLLMIHHQLKILLQKGFFLEHLHFSLGIFVDADTSFPPKIYLYIIASMCQYGHKSWLLTHAIYFGPTPSLHALPSNFVSIFSGKGCQSNRRSPVQSARCFWDVIWNWMAGVFSQSRDVLILFHLENWKVVSARLDDPMQEHSPTNVYMGSKVRRVSVCLLSRCWPSWYLWPWLSSQFLKEWSFQRS